MIALPLISSALVPKTLFHGTGGDRFTLREPHPFGGGDPNAVLGLHMAEDREVAGEFAEQSADPHVVCLTPKFRQTGVISSMDVFYGTTRGCSGAGAHYRAQNFIALREQLLAAGYDSVVTDWGEASYWVALTPTASLTVVGSIPVNARFWKTLPKRKAA